MDIKYLRDKYKGKVLKKSLMNQNPFIQFHEWFEEALKIEAIDINAMALATTNAKGHPSIRHVLLKEFSEKGFLFFSNYESKKGEDLANNPYAAVSFYWRELARQVCLEGRVERISEEESNHYFNERPRGSQLSCWASKQSREISSRKKLEECFRKYEVEFIDKEVPRPSYWGGYCLIPSRFEFWQGQADRLHDRICYSKEGAEWVCQRLSP